MEIAIILGLILLNGVFSMSEIAVISARKTSLQNEAEHDNKAAKSALNLANNPDRFLSTIQVGITLIGIMTGLYSGDILTVHFAPVLEKWGMTATYAYPIAKISIVIVVTYLSIVFGELVPKRIGMSAAEKVAKIIAPPMQFISVVATPFVWILSKSTALISGFLGIKEKNDAKVTEEEIKYMIKEGTEDGEVQEVEQDIMERVFNLGDRDLESIMTHRGEMVWIDVNMETGRIKEIIKNNPFDKYPVADRELDNIEGVVYLKDLFLTIDMPDFDLRQNIRKAEFFYESMEVYAALEKMKVNHVPYALIIDEFGSIKGMVTLKDIMEALVGEMPEPDDVPEIIQRKDGTFLVDGQSSFYNFLNYFDITDMYPKYDYNTLGGLILDTLGDIPKEGERIEWNDFTFEVIDMDGARIDKILVTKK